jgi:hypothetical protein
MDCMGSLMALPFLKVIAFRKDVPLKLNYLGHTLVLTVLPET